MIPDLTVFLNTHSNYADLWPAFFGRWQRHSGRLAELSSVVSADTEDVAAAGNWGVFVYDRRLSFSEQYRTALARISSPYMLTLQEDYILYCDVDCDRLASHVAFLEEHSEYSYVRLIMSGYGSLIQLGEGRFDIQPDFFPWYSMQPTIWRTEALRRIYDTMRPCNPWDAEPEGEKFTRENGIKGVLSWRGEPARGRMHCDSSEFPYICTAVVKGKWNTPEYPIELASVFEEYGIDPSLRGQA